MEIKYPDGRVVVGEYWEIAKLLNGVKQNGKSKVEGERYCEGCGDALTGKRMRWCIKPECKAKAKAEYIRNSIHIRKLKSRPRIPNGRHCLVCNAELTGFQQTCCGKKECIKARAEATRLEKIKREQSTEATAGTFGTSTN